jgi:hypothetical protein
MVNPDYSDTSVVNVVPICVVFALYHKTVVIPEEVFESPNEK